jgi:hypothetical protein
VVKKDDKEKIWPNYAAELMKYIMQPPLTVEEKEKDIEIKAGRVVEILTGDIAHRQAILKRASELNKILCKAALSKWDGFARYTDQIIEEYNIKGDNNEERLRGALKIWRKTHRDWGNLEDDTLITYYYRDKRKATVKWPRLLPPSRRRNKIAK